MLVQEAPDERQSESEAEGEAKCKVKATDRFGLPTIARDRSIGEPFRLDVRKDGENFVCYLYGRINGGRIAQITRTSYSRSPNYNEIMDTILEEVKAGALTTKGQAIDRREELLRIDRAEHASDMYAIAERVRRHPSVAADAD